MNHYGFPAKYNGVCDYCYEKVEKGDMITFWHGHLYHVNCKREAYKEEVEREKPKTVID